VRAANRKEEILSRLAVPGTTAKVGIPYPIANISPMRTIAADFVGKTRKQTIAVTPLVCYNSNYRIEVVRISQDEIPVLPVAIAPWTA
jgi:hypothetical protein